MTDFPTIGPPPLFLTTAGPGAAWWSRSSGAVVSAGGSITWVANVAVFVPVRIPWSYPVKRVFWVNGATASSNADFGIYTASGTRIYSVGSTGQSGASVPQYTTPGTPFILDQGWYYFAAGYTGTTGRGWGSATAVLNLRKVGVLQQATAIPLPATMASATTAAQALFPICGITRTTTGF